MKICVFGGTFDPLHIGHESLIKVLLKRFDKVIIMPAKQSPGKKTPIASEMDRLNMLSLSSVIDNSDLMIDDYELRSKKEFSFTVDSIRYISNKFKNDEIYLALGIDQFNNLYRWYNIEQLLSMVKIICFNRNGFINQNFQIECEMIEEFNYDISSSQIKDLISKKSSKVKNMINTDIFEYIMKENLYK